MKKYEVNIISVTPAYGENNSIEYFHADSASDAIKQARAMMRLNGHTRQDGSLKYKAKVAS